MRFAVLKNDDVILRALPAWPAGPRTLVSLGDFTAEIARQSPHVSVEPAKDSQFIAVPASALSGAIAYTLAALAKQGVSYTAESFDCEDFVNAVDLTLRMMAAKAGIKAAPLTACLTVSASVTWADVMAGGYHAIMATMTDAGVFVSESQNGQSIALPLYPNRSGIIEVSNL
jgi:hypothetical protein